MPRSVNGLSVLLLQFYQETTLSTALDSSTREEIAQTIFRSLRESYLDSDVSIETCGSTVTIARGRPAVQLQVIDRDQFQVSKRTRYTFHMIGGAIGLRLLMQIIQTTIGDAPEL